MRLHLGNERHRIELTDCPQHAERRRHAAGVIDILDHVVVGPLDGLVAEPLDVIAKQRLDVAVADYVPGPARIEAIVGDRGHAACLLSVPVDLLPEIRD